MALLRCIPALDKIEGLEGDMPIGINIVKRALEEPLRTLVNNAGMEGSLVAQEVRKNPKKTFGYDVERDQYVDMIEAGIIDPKKVTRTALQNASSIAGLMIMTEAMISEIPEPEKPMPGGGAGGGMGDMY